MKRRLPLLLAVLLPIASFGASVPENLGLGLKELVESYQNDPAQFRATMSSSTNVQSDAADRVIVNIHLDGAKRVDDLRADLEGLGLEILAVDSNWRKGVISARLPVSLATVVAQLPGVRSVMLAPKPQRRVGSVTAESSVVEHADIVNAAGKFRAQGILGGGISVGIVSDSYDTKSPHASAGIASGDLPGPGNPDYPTAVVVLPPDSPGTDEGRGMAEIVHDIAPGAKICFSGVASTSTDMVNSIHNLRTNQSASCDIIADDIYFFDEPFFSDGPIAKAVDDVVTSDVLAGKKVIYFSAAGNEGNSGYASDLRLVPSTAPKGNLNFASVPTNKYAGGFHNFDSTGGTRIAMTAKTDSHNIVVLQWDDPFDAGAITTDYNLLVFSSAGSYLGSKSGTDNNFSTDEPIEMTPMDAPNYLAANTTYEFVIALASATTSPPTATHLRIVSFQGSLSGSDIAYNASTLFGHPVAANANAVGAYNYSYKNDPAVTFPSFNPGMLNPPPGPYRYQLEGFSSNGGSIPIYFDSTGTRQVNPILRQKPEFCAADGVDTSFFGSDSDNDGFPNFFGTSAAAPTAAAIGALILDAAGGPLSRTADQMRTLMEQSVFPHDLDPNVCTATATNGTATVQVIANGNTTNDSANDPNFFTVTFNGNNGETLNQLIIDLTNTPLVFDESMSTGFPFTVGSPGGVSATHTLSPDDRVLTINFGNTFNPGESISFGIDRDYNEVKSGGNSADLLAAADIKATIDSGTILLGAFANVLGTGFTFADGYGLVNAQAAVESILAPLPASSGVAANLSTRALTLTGDNVLIGGFIIQGPSSKNVIIRALGPSLASSGVSGVLADPYLELHNSNGTIIYFDDDWQDDPAQKSAIQDAGFAPSDPKESALDVTLVPGAYTAIVHGTGNPMGTGVALVELYDHDAQPPASQFGNISTRAPVQTGDDVMIGGFIITGTDPLTVVVRGIGPSLSPAIAGALADPFLELHDGQGNIIGTNDNWQQDSLQATQIRATGLQPSNALESAILMTLNPGVYTAIVKGAQSTTGVGLVEVYRPQ